MQYRPRLGQSVPTQQSSTTCGSACLTVARMMADDGLARWVAHGQGTGESHDPGAALRRFARYERLVKARTNALIGPHGRWQLPWPRALGTPPWGAARELELASSDGEVTYRTSLVRVGGPTARREQYGRLAASVQEGQPALLYVGSRWLPRHVVLVMAGTGRNDLDVYEPGCGRVLDLSRGRYLQRRLGLGGWDVPWLVVSAPPPRVTPAR